ncbi:Metallo-hydrolase/oxidoreductase [Irpex rosettiformis]|uniref:Metallo-hydrolase/oxidoreductase n=1 Tax=Irpex rosettiformis TaxID=378272 RepID=A0ACB8UHJ0_9APHY|nr:Metallo-hydrolase/oxidoreductase [Irpex rosettiformis]
MTEMPVVPHLTRLSRNVTRILGQNPSKFTLQGTNTYLVGQTNPYILVDTAEGRDEYIPYLREALLNPGIDIVKDKPDVSDVILTHKHHDHVNGLPSVLALLQQLWSDRNPGEPFIGPRIHKFPLLSAEVEKVLATLPSGSFTPSPSGLVLHSLHEGQTFHVTQLPSTPDKQQARQSSSTLQVIHTPGHTSDSLCLYFPPDSALFTADTVLGSGSSVFEDLHTYMSSLRQLIKFKSASDGSRRYTIIYPGHGPTAPHDQVDTYLSHRVDRENQVLKAIKEEPPTEKILKPEEVEESEEEVEVHWTTWEIMKSIYAEKYPEALWEPAAHSVHLHLHKLVVDGKVEKGEGEGFHTKWKFLNEQA